MTETFFVYDKCYYGIREFIEDHLFGDYKEDLSDLPDDWQIECNEAELQPLLNFTKDWIYERINEERYPEDEDATYLKLRKAIDLIPFDKVMEAMPQLWYETENKFVLTKQDLLEYI
jgi:hypothetical protein